MNQELRVKITRIVYRNEENGYTVAEAENLKDERQCTVVGNLPFASKGGGFILQGKWVEHQSYGEQFKFSEFEELPPSGEDAIFEFLTSGIFHSVGPETAKAIIRRFGSDTLEIVESEPGRLREVTGIGPKKAASIAEDYALHKEFANVALFLQDFGLKPNYALKLYRQYGQDTVKLIKENPYRVIADIWGIGFRKADEIAMKMGIERDDAFRIESGIRFVLSSSVSDGHCFLEKSELFEAVAELLGLGREDIEPVYVDMIIDGTIQADTLENREVVYLYRYYRAERNVCSRLMGLAEARPKMVNTDVKTSVKMMEIQQGIELSENQRRAVEAAVSSGVCVITGGPGTGKTTIINAIIRCFMEGGLEVAIAAPTGRAAKRITETSGYPAQTIHRLLEYSYFEDSEYLIFGRNIDNPLEYDAVIIDEASMIDLMLMNGLLNAIRPGTRLVLVGDADQLPSVGAGNVLRDILDSESIYSIRLTEIFRQAQESMIVVNAHRINSGEYPECNSSGGDFFLMRMDREEDILATVKELVSKRLPAYYSEVAPEEIQVLTPTRRRTLGSINLNSELQRVLNPERPGVSQKAYGDRIFREKDKVMQIKNNYELEWRKISDGTDGKGVFNGDIGIISSIDLGSGIITVCFDGDKYVNYNYENLDQLELAYAVTVHKSQGSEFPVVVMPVSWFPPMLATRNLLYTAVTRGKEGVVLVGSEEKLRAMVDNNLITRRNSGLKARLIQLRDFGASAEPDLDFDDEIFADIPEGIFDE